jgi:hypothetical protein
MSQIASFTYLKESDVPFLGFWSKPKSRLFHKAESKFTELLRQHALREAVLEAADGVYVALVFAWLEKNGGWLDGEADPVLHTVRKQVGGSHWLAKSGDVQRVLSIKEQLSQSEWSSFLQKINGNEANCDWHSFDTVIRFVRERLCEVKSGEALLISIG